MQTYEDTSKNIKITASKIEIGENVFFGENININVRDNFKIGNHSKIFGSFQAKAQNIELGEYFFQIPISNGIMDIGGGGSNFAHANLKFGDRCVCHTGHINLARPVNIGNDVGLSHDVHILTHGFWASVLDGYPAAFEPVTIQNNVILGWKTLVCPGVKIVSNTVIGANSTVVKSLLEEHASYAGSPAVLKRKIEKPTMEKQIEILENLVEQFKQTINKDFQIKLNFPEIICEELTLNCITFDCFGKHSSLTDALRDFLRRYGIRFYHPRGFSFDASLINYELPI
jgi:acetyltransferase-like isoleucine patch superfamily enzyme